MNKGLVLFLVFLLLFSLVMMVDYAVADGEEEHEDEGEDFEGGEFAESSGTIALYGAILFNALYIPVNRLRRKGAIQIPGSMFLNIHIAINLILGFFALWHAATLSPAAGPVEYLSVALIMYLIASGLVMRFPARTRAKTLARLMHAQLIVSIILVFLLAIHVSMID